MSYSKSRPCPIAAQTVVGDPDRSVDSPMRVASITGLLTEADGTTLRGKEPSHDASEISQCFVDCHVRCRGCYRRRPDTDRAAERYATERADRYRTGTRGRQHCASSRLWRNDDAQRLDHESARNGDRPRCAN